MSPSKFRSCFPKGSWDQKTQQHLQGSPFQSARSPFGNTLGTCCSPAICPQNCGEQGPTSPSHILGYKPFACWKSNTSFARPPEPLGDSGAVSPGFVPAAPSSVGSPPADGPASPCCAPQRGEQKELPQSLALWREAARATVHQGVLRTPAPVKPRGNLFLVCFQMSRPLSRSEISYSAPRAKIHSLGQHSRFCISVKSLLALLQASW